MRTALVAITGIYLLRGLVLVPLLAFRPDKVDAFALWSSLIVLAYGIAYAVGTWRAWPALSAGRNERTLPPHHPRDRRARGHRGRAARRARARRRARC